MELCFNEMTVMKNGTLPEDIALCAQAGFSAVELRKGTLLRYLRGGGTLEALRQTLEEQHVRAASLNALESVSFQARAVGGVHAHVGGFHLEGEYAHKALARASALKEREVVRIVRVGEEPVGAAKLLLDRVQTAQQSAQIMTGAAVDGVEVKKAGQMVVFKFLPRVEQRRALEKIEHCRVVHERALVAHKGGDARLVVVFQKAELVVVRGVAGLLKVQRVQIAAQGDLAAQIPVEYLAHIVLVLQIEGTKHLAVRRGIDAVPPSETAIAAVDRFGEPDAVRVYGGDRRAGLQPEFHGDEGCHIAAEAVHQTGPHYERIRQILPKPAVGVVQVDDVGPVTKLIARLAVGPAVEVFRMLAVEHGCKFSG